MGIIQRQSLKGLLTFVIGAVIHMVTMLLIMPNILAEADVAVFRVYLALITISGMVGVAGANGLYLKFFSDFRDNKNQREVINLVSLLYAFVVSVIIALALYFSADIIYSLKKTSAPYLMKYYACVPLGGICFSLIYYFEAYSLANHRLTAPSVVKEFLLKIILLLLVILYYYKIITIYTFFWGYAFSYFVGFTVLLFYCYYIKDYRLKWDSTVFKSIIWKRYYPYVLFTLLSSVLSSLLLNVDQILVYHMLGSKTAVYGVAVTIASMITIPYKPLAAIIFPILSDSWHQEDYEKLSFINKQSSLYLSAIGMLLFLLLVSNVGLLYKILPPSYHSIFWPLLILSLGRVLDYTTGTSTELVLTSPRYRIINPFILISFIASVICYFILIPRFGQTGAAIATSMALVIFNVLKYFHLRNRYQLQPFDVRILYVFLVGIITYAIQCCLPKFDYYLLDLFVRSAVITILFCGSFLYFKIIPELQWQNIKNFKGAFTRFSSKPK